MFYSLIDVLFHVRREGKKFQTPLPIFIILVQPFSKNIDNIHIKTFFKSHSGKLKKIKIWKISAWNSFTKQDIYLKPRFFFRHSNWNKSEIKLRDLKNIFWKTLQCAGSLNAGARIIGEPNPFYYRITKIVIHINKYFWGSNNILHEGIKSENLYQKL